MRYALHWLVLLLVLLPGAPAVAQIAGKLQIIQDTLQGTEPQPVDILPDPAALQVRWWHYFDVEGEALEQRIRATAEYLDALLIKVPDEQREAAGSFIELIKANLQALPEARAQPSPTPPSPPSHAESYSISQVLALAERLRQARAALETASVDVAAAEKTLNAVSRRSDTLMAAYLALSPSDPVRILRGLEIMAERTSLMVVGERLRVDKAGVQVQQVRIQQLGEELSVARQRLTAHSSDMIELRRSILELETELERAHGRLIREQTGATRVVGNTPADRATALYRQQRVVKAAIEEASVRVRLLRARIEDALTRLLLGRLPDTSELRQQQVAWGGELDEIERLLQIWEADSERERERTGQVINIETDDGTGSAQFLALINQDRFNLAQETLVAAQRLRIDIGQGRMLLQMVDAQLLRIEGRLSDWLAWLKQQFRALKQEAGSWINASLFTIGDTPVTALGLLRVVLILGIAWLMSYWLRRMFHRLGQRGDGSNQPAFYTIGRLTHYLLILLGVFVGLSSIGMDFTNFALVAGALAIGIGFGLQAIVNNFISGLILLFERSLKVGDFVELASPNPNQSVAGEVKAINVRSTQIKTNENIDIVVPNSQFMNSNVINWTLQEPYMRVHYPFRVAFGFDKELVRRAGLEAAEKVPHTLSGLPGKNPQVWLVGYGENGYDFELVVWLTPTAVKRPQAVRAAYYWELETALQKYGIEVPVPQRDLRLREGFSGWTTTGAPAAGAPAAGPTLSG